MASAETLEKYKDSPLQPGGNPIYRCYAYQPIDRDAIEVRVLRYVWPEDSEKPFGENARLTSSGVVWERYEDFATLPRPFVDISGMHLVKDQDVPLPED